MTPPKMTLGEIWGWGADQNQDLSWWVVIDVTSQINLRCVYPPDAFGKGYFIDPHNHHPVWRDDHYWHLIVSPKPPTVSCG